MIQLQSISLRRGTKVLLKDSSASVFAGHKVAIIGRNGCGKSTLFALLQGALDVDEGDVHVPAHWNIVSVAQETPSSSKSALEYVIDGDEHVRNLQELLAHAEQQNDGAKIAQLHVQLDEAGAFDISARAAKILAGLSFSQPELSRAVSTFSGGWRMRLNLARALLCPSDLLLLDEPTNHLDLDAVIWLEQWLQRYEGTLLLISHDKAFIDQTVKHIVSFEQQNLFSYTGNYSSFEKQQIERLRLQNIEYEKQQQKVEHLNSFIRRFKAKASKAKQAQSRIKQLEKMEELLPAHQDSQFNFSFAPSKVVPNPLTSMKSMQLGYGEITVLEHVDLNLVPGSRIGLLGRNGQGKSTLIKLLAGELAPISGEFAKAQGTNIGYFAQHQLETLDVEASALLHMQRLDPNATEQELRNFLGGFNFHGDDALEPVAPMSGGEKARLVLAILVYQKPNLLLLDEPTNHLDLDMRHALTMALQYFDGALVLVSHDRFLLEAVCEDFYLVNNKRVARFEGDLQDYRRWILSKSEPDITEKLDSSHNKQQEPQVDRKAQKRIEAELRVRKQPYTKALQQAERALDKAISRKNSLELQLADPDIYSDENKQNLKLLLAEQASLVQKIETLEIEWLEAQEALERIELGA